MANGYYFPGIGFQPFTKSQQQDIANDKKWMPAIGNMDVAKSLIDPLWAQSGGDINTLQNLIRQNGGQGFLGATNSWNTSDGNYSYDFNPGTSGNNLLGRATGAVMNPIQNAAGSTKNFIDNNIETAIKLGAAGLGAYGAASAAGLLGESAAAAPAANTPVTGSGILGGMQGPSAELALQQAAPAMYAGEPIAGNVVADLAFNPATNSFALDALAPGTTALLGANAAQQAAMTSYAEDAANASGGGSSLLSPGKMQALNYGLAAAGGLSAGGGGSSYPNYPPGNIPKPQLPNYSFLNQPRTGPNTQMVQYAPGMYAAQLTPQFAQGLLSQFPARQPYLPGPT